MRLIDADKMKEYMKVFTSKELMENEEVFEIIDEQPTVPIFGQWNSVMKRLPETSGMYLVTKAPYYISVLPFSVKHKAFNTYDVSISKDKAIPVDYWMPLPEPPKGETNEL